MKNTTVCFILLAAVKLTSVFDADIMLSFMVELGQKIRDKIGHGGLDFKALMGTVIEREGNSSSRRSLPTYCERCEGSYTSGYDI
jgi:hypothetical protein